jgi:hypothetical protein
VPPSLEEATTRGGARPFSRRFAIEPRHEMLSHETLRTTATGNATLKTHSV